MFLFSGKSMRKHHWRWAPQKVSAQYRYILMHSVFLEKQILATHYASENLTQRTYIDEYLLLMENMCNSKQRWTYTGGLNEPRDPWQNCQLIYFDKHTCTDEKCPAGMINFRKLKVFTGVFYRQGFQVMQSS